MDFYNFCTVVNRKKHVIYIRQKFTPHLNNVLTLPSENKNITFHTFIMHSLNITRCIKLNDRPDRTREGNCMCISDYVTQIYSSITWYSPNALKPISTTRVDGWPVSIWRACVSTSRIDGPCWRPVNSASGNARPSTRPVLTGNENRSPVNLGRQLG